MSIKEAIRAKALEIGFDVAGFAAAALPPQTRADLNGWLALGCHGDMNWMAETFERRADPQVLWPEARSVVVLGLNYTPPGDPLALLAHPQRGLVSAYARNSDYHDLVKKRLKQLARWMVETHGGGVKVFVDTAPVLEKPLAAQAGLGWQGKHCVLVSRRFGSWLFLGEVFTTLDLPPDSPEPDHCGSCQRCQDICPTNAFLGPHRLDARRCLAYLNNEHKGPIPLAFRAAMGNRIYGCDDCLAVCPWNKFAAQTREAAFLPRAELTAPRLADLVELDDAGFRVMFSGSPIKRLGRDRFLRNVLIALGNCGDAAYRARIEPFLHDPSPLVRGACIWALARILEQPSWAELREKHLPGEHDPDVIAEWSPTEFDPGRLSCDTQRRANGETR